MCQNMARKGPQPQSVRHPREHGDGWILPAEQMENLRQKPYLYNASAGSVLELLFLQRFWTWLVSYVPQWVAPCVLTALGLIINAACCLTILYYSPDTRTEAPWWCFVLCAVGLFLYQTLDALDGKQAIKVQNSQIEEVYDHGCDAVSTVFVMLAVSVTIQMGSMPVLQFMLFLASVLTFFSTHWQDHVTHVMVFGKVDVSEAQCITMLIHLLTAIFGQQIWQTQIGLWNLEIRHLLVLGVLTTLSNAMLTNLGFILGRETPLDSVAKIPRKKGPSIWNPAYPALALTLLAIRAYTVGLFHVSCSVFILAFGLAYAKITIKLVMTNVSYGDMEKWDSSLVAPLLLCVNTFIQLLHPYTALLCVLVYSVMDFARYFTYASWDLRDALDLWIFTLKYPVGHPSCRNGNLGFYVNGLNNNEIKEQAEKCSYEELLASNNSSIRNKKSQ